MPLLLLVIFAIRAFTIAIVEIFIANTINIDNAVSIICYGYCDIVINTGNGTTTSSVTGKFSITIMMKTELNNTIVIIVRAVLQKSELTIDSQSE